MTTPAPTKTPPTVRFIPFRRFAPAWPAGVLEIVSGKQTGRYLVWEWPADWGRAFLLRKPDGETYRANIGPEPATDLCDCTGFLQYGRCKHVASLRTITERGGL